MRSGATFLAVGVLALTGCGGGGTKTVTQVDSTPATTGGGGTTATTPSIPPIAVHTTPTTSTPSASGGTLAGAEAAVKAQGFTVDDPNDYDSSHTLRVLIGTRTGSGDGFAKRAFFFAGGRFLGTDTSDDSAGIRVDHQEDTLVTLSYPLYRRKDPLCCPSGGQKLVRYQWNGSKLTPLDQIPTSSGNAPLSRQ